MGAKFNTDKPDMSPAAYKFTVMLCGPSSRAASDEESNSTCALERQEHTGGLCQSTHGKLPRNRGVHVRKLRLSSVSLSPRKPVANARGAYLGRS